MCRGGSLKDGRWALRSDPGVREERSEVLLRSQTQKSSPRAKHDFTTIRYRPWYDKDSLYTSAMDLDKLMMILPMS